MSLVGDDFRNLAYKLCEGRKVPLLATDIIAGFLVHRDLFKINVLSRSLNEQANAIIYRDVVVDLDGSAQAVTKASLLCRTLLTCENAARAVRSLSLAGDPLQDWREGFTTLSSSHSIEGPLRGRVAPAIHADLTNFTKAEIELYDNLAASASASTRPTTSEVPVWALYLHTLRLVPRIQDFSVSSDYFRFPDFRSTLEDMARDPSTEKLRSCSLCLDLLSGEDRHACVAEDWDSALLALIAAPKVQSLAAVVCLAPENVRQLRLGESSITRLVLHHYQIRDSDLNTLLAATPNLKFLEYRATTDFGWARPPYGTPQPSVGHEPLFNSLHHVSDSLQELHISHEFDEDSFHYQIGWASEHEPPFRQRGELSGLKRLHTLTIPYATLLGWKHKECVWEWDTILPPSLRRIVLTDGLQVNCFDDPWTDENLMPVISRLLEWLTAPQRGIVTAEFGMHLDTIQNDFNEPERQELHRMCAERGVRCSIKKMRADLPKPAPFPRGQVSMSRGLGRGRGRGRGA